VSVEAGLGLDQAISRVGAELAFAYPELSDELRLINLELRELLDEAGFSQVRVHWEGEDDDGEANGEFFETMTGEPDPAWVAYILAEK
jgi:hypothetical protein